MQVQQGHTYIVDYVENIGYCDKITLLIKISLITDKFIIYGIEGGIKIFSKDNFYAEFNENGLLQSGAFIVLEDITEYIEKNPLDIFDK